MLTVRLSQFLVAQVLMSLASVMLSVAVGWHIYEATGNPFDLALVGLMQILPIAGLFIVSGWVIDNVQRKYVLVACTVLQGLVLVGLAVVFASSEFDRFSVFALLFANGVARAFYMPAGQSALPGIVTQEQLSRAVAISSTLRTSAEAAGPFVAGLLIAWLDKDVYPVLATLCFLAGPLYVLLPIAPVRRPVGRGLAQLLDGLRFVTRSPLALPAISLDLIIVLVGSVVALLPVYAIDILNVGPEALGLMRAMPALGAVGAGVLFSRLADVRNTGSLLFVSLAVFGLSIVAFALSGSLWVTLVALFVYGATDMVSVNVRLTTIQLATPDELRGRVNSVNSLFIATSNDMGDFRAGTVATLLGPVATAFVGGLMAVGVAVGGYFLFPTLRQLDRLTDAREESNRPASQRAT
ncbi:MAG: MFS transporter [Pseudomonadota bacterium]